MGTGALPSPSGANSGEPALEAAQDTTKRLAEWMAEHPLILNEEDAREAKLLHDSGSLAKQDLEDERTTRLAPPRREMEVIQDRYKPVQGSLAGAVAQLGARLDKYLAQEEERRAAAAEAARREVAAAAKDLELAAAKETEAAENAALGELGVDTVAAAEATDAAYEAYERAQRQAALAERESQVRIGGGFRRALSRRSKEILEVTDWAKAIIAIGLVDRIRDAILTEARAYRQEYGHLPPGIQSYRERSV